MITATKTKPQLVAAARAQDGDGWRNRIPPTPAGWQSAVAVLRVAVQSGIETRSTRASLLAALDGIAQYGPAFTEKERTDAWVAAYDVARRAMLTSTYYIAAAILRMGLHSGPFTITHSTNILSMAAMGLAHKRTGRKNDWDVEGKPLSAWLKSDNRAHPCPGPCLDPNLWPDDSRQAWSKASAELAPIPFSIRMEE